MHLEIAQSNAHANATTATLKQQITEDYETKAQHDRDVANIKSTQSKMWQSQKELENGQEQMKLTLEHVSDALGANGSHGN